MKNFSKLTAFIMAIIVLVLCFAGCGEKETASGDITTITLWTGAGHSKAYMEKLFEEYNNGQGKKDGIRFEATYIGSESYSKSIELALQNGSAPDFFSTSQVQKNVELGKLLAIEDLPGGAEFLKKYEGKLEQNKTTFDGKTYRVPKAATTMGLMYNVDMFKAAGIVDENGNALPPKTFDELREVAKKLTNPGKKQYGIIYPRKWSSWADSDIVYTAAPSAGHLDYDYVTGEFDLSQTKPIIKHIMDVIADGSAFPGATNIDNDAARAYFAEGNIGMKIGMSFDVGVLKDQFPAKIDWDVAPLPVLDENDTYKQRLYYDYSYIMNADSLKRVGGEKMMKAFAFLSGEDFIMAAYKNGISIPYDYSIVKDVEIDDSMKQWKNFCKMVDISVDYPAWPQTTMSSMENFPTKVNRILGGELTIDEGVDAYEADRKKGVEIYYSEHPDAWKMPEEYIQPDWNAKR